MRDDHIQLFNLSVGPGSQDEGDMVLDYMKMPGEMNTYDLPVLPEAEDVQKCPAAVAVMDQLQTLIAAYQIGDSTEQMALDTMPEPDLDLLNQVFGEGEVSIVIDGDAPLRIQETVMAGVWRARQMDEEGDVVSERLEVADIPSAVRAAAFSGARPFVAIPEQMPEGLLNAPSVLVEIADVSQRFSEASEQPEQPHVINLSLLPFSPEDHSYLNEQLGVGAVTILSRGYGNCRITSTNVPGLWRVQYFNSTDQLILDTLEVTEVPAVACAAAEDLQDSAERLTEIRDVLM
ncbi:MAG: hydrogenase expression/formation protein [Pontibacterium sp.]